jgi:hypothetical protein
MASLVKLTLKKDDDSNTNKNNDNNNKITIHRSVRQRSPQHGTSSAQ